MGAEAGGLEKGKGSRHLEGKQKSANTARTERGPRRACVDGHNGQVLQVEGPRMKGRGGQEFRQHWGRTGKYRAKSQKRTELSWTSLSLSNA